MSATDRGIPAAREPRPAALPAPVERTLDNGLRVVAFAQRNLPLIAAQLVIRGGGSAETDDEAGLSAFVAALLTQGTTSHTAVEIATITDALGARLDAGSGYDASLVGASATTPAFPAAFALMADVVRHPAFLPDEVDRVRAKSLSDLSLTYANASAVARLAAQRVAYGASPYGHPLAGTVATLPRLTRDRAAWFHERFYRPDNAVLVIGGDLSTDDAFALAERVLGDWHAPAAPLAERPAAPLPPALPRILAIDKPDSGRTALVVGERSIERASPDYYAAMVAVAVLSGYSGRLNQEVRVKRGLSYGAGASLAARRMAGIFTASTLVDHTRAAEATEVVRTTLRSLVEQPATDADLVARKATIAGGFHRTIETIDGIAGSIAELVLYNVPLDELSAYLGRVQAVGADDVRAFAERRLREPFVVLVGDTAKFAPDLRAQGHAVEIIAAAALDLDAHDLVRAALPTG